MRLKTMLLIGGLAVVSAPAVAAPTDTPAKVEQVAPTIAPPPAGMGQVVFYRPSSMGALVSCRVHEAGAVVNKLPPGRYFVHQTTPGIHEYTVKSEATDKLKVNVEDGETQYARCAINMGMFSGRPNLSTQDRADFDKRGKKLKLQDPFQAKEDEDEKAEAKPTEAATN
ncbi:MAG TPA: DUF2846 domain-containing protein [Sphingomicrobium sp.]|nr:DUF2846 domain-containing protein [Sphingomicrobium sp.]